MFLLGQWRNFEELEEWLTLDELFEAFNALTEKENRRMEFEARLAGAEMKGESNKNSRQADTDKSSLVDRIRARQQAEREQAGGQKKPSEFSQGVGYQTIGG